MVWQPGQLQVELTSGIWYCAAASRVLALKQCLSLPLPLWREVLHLMGECRLNIDITLRQVREFEADEQYQSSNQPVCRGLGSNLGSVFLKNCTSYSRVDPKSLE